jgi:hypothetical protein
MFVKAMAVERFQSLGDVSVLKTAFETIHTRGVSSPNLSREVKSDIIFNYILEFWSQS